MSAMDLISINIAIFIPQVAFPLHTLSAASASLDIL
jgi:uncharacterized membrane protein YqaE (UPF0057 family)